MGDQGQRTFKGYDDKAATRTEHVMMTGDVFGRLEAVHIDDTCGISDHNPVHLAFREPV